MTTEDERSGDLLDVTLRDEIELVSDLVVAASSSHRHFTPDEVDELLGVAPAPASSPDACPTGAHTGDTGDTADTARNADTMAPSATSTPSVG
ncbi:MAG: hypothetical protein ABI112_02720 [Terracoccus sp.]